MNNIQWKQKFISEMRLFCIYSIFLMLLFCSLTTYRRLILGEYSINYFHYGYGVIEALILSKIILIGEALGLGEKFTNKPLIVPTLYKTVIFSLFVFLFSIMEHFIIGSIRGIDFMTLYHEFVNTGIDEVLARVLIIFLVFILFFAFIETARILGQNKLIELFLHKRTDKDWNSSS